MSLFVFQRRRELRGSVQVQRPYLPGRRGSLDPPRHLPGASSPSESFSSPFSSSSASSLSNEHLFLYGLVIRNRNPNSTPCLRNESNPDQDHSFLTFNDHAYI